MEVPQYLCVIAQRSGCGAFDTFDTSTVAPLGQKFLPQAKHEVSVKIADKLLMTDQDNLGFQARFSFGATDQEVWFQIQPDRSGRYLRNPTTSSGSYRWTLTRGTWSWSVQSDGLRTGH